MSNLRKLEDTQELALLCSTPFKGAGIKSLDPICDFALGCSSLCLNRAICYRWMPLDMQPLREKLRFISGLKSFSAQTGSVNGLKFVF